MYNTEAERKAKQETNLIEKTWQSPNGSIHYWVSDGASDNAAQAPWLVFLPGLTADHQMFAQQIAYFQNQCNCLVWDAPAHGQSRPCSLTYSLQDLTHYLHSILEAEGIRRFVLIGHSMGGFIAQLYMAVYPGEAAGFISIDSAPLEREYYKTWELFSLKHTKGMYKAIPWHRLVAWSATGNAETVSGQSQMTDTMLQYSRDEFCSLAGHGYRIIAEAIEAYEPDLHLCPVLLLCGEQDKTGFVLRYNKAWAKRTGYPLVWIPKAGHNAITDNPDAVNAQIAHFLDFISEAK